MCCCGKLENRDLAQVAFEILFFEIFISLFLYFNISYFIGISLKTQICYFVVFVTRYLDLPWNIFHPTLFHLYLASMKIIYIGATAMIIYYIHIKYRSTYNADEDGLPLYVSALFIVFLLLVSYSLVF